MLLRSAGKHKREFRTHSIRSNENSISFHEQMTINYDWTIFGCDIFGFSHGK